MRKTYNNILDAITAPLGFYVLSLLIVETFLATVLTASTLQNSDKVCGMYLGVGLFIFVVLIVTLFVWFKPDHLTFDKESHLRQQGKPPFGSNSLPLKDLTKLTPTTPKE